MFSSNSAPATTKQSQNSATATAVTAKGTGKATGAIHKRPIHTHPGPLRSPQGYAGKAERGEPLLEKGPSRGSLLRMRTAATATASAVHLSPVLWPQPCLPHTAKPLRKGCNLLTDDKDPGTLYPHCSWSEQDGSHVLLVALESHEAMQLSETGVDLQGQHSAPTHPRLTKVQ